MQMNALTVVARIKPDHIGALERLLEDIGADPGGNRYVPFGTMQSVHFASWMIAARDPAYPPSLIFETTCDGPLEDHLDELVTTAAAGLEAIYEMCEGYPTGEAGQADRLRQYLREHAAPAAAFFVGVPGQSVASIRNAVAVRDEVDAYLASGRARTTLDGLTPAEAERSIAIQLEGRATVTPEPSPLSLEALQRRALRHGLLLLLVALPLVVLLLPLLVLFLARVRRLEIRDDTGPSPPSPPVDPRLFDLDAGRTQNHLTTLIEVKPGAFRQRTLRVVLWLLQLLIRTKVLTASSPRITPTVHSARWVPLDGNRRLLFATNFDGSWTSYLGDFADRTSAVLNAIWANTEGCPPTRYLVLGGTAHLEAFKSWTRAHSLYPLVFYRAYPEETVLNLQQDARRRDAYARILDARRAARSSRHAGRTIDLADVQGLVRSGHQHMPHLRSIFLRIEKGDLAREWLAGALEEIPTAEDRPAGSAKPESAVHLALAPAGLRALGLPDETMATFPRAFLVGMADPGRSVMLGDTGSSRPDVWEVGAPGVAEPHILALLYATTPDVLDALTHRLLGTPAAAALAEVFRQDAYRGSPMEPFGFRDGISQPAVEGLGTRPKPGPAPVRPGEFVLGYRNEYGDRPPMPTVPGALDRSGILPVDPTDAGRAQLGHGGTFLVWRKLQQDVEGFWRFVESHARDHDGAIDPQRRTRMAAMLMGRWPSGAPLVLTPRRDAPGLGASDERNNDFEFRGTDRDGEVCPMGAHIRRANPRDSLAASSPGLSRRISNRHRIIRRGRPYAEPAGDGAERRGLVFIALNADLERQFEFIQQTWVNNASFNGLHGEKDPITGDNDGRGAFSLPDEPVPHRIGGVPRFVTVRGGGYFFLPGMRALRFLASAAA